MMRKHEETFAINLLVNFFVCFVFHIIRVVRRHAVNDDFLVQLYGKSVLINGNLLDVVTAANLDTRLGY